MAEVLSGAGAADASGPNASLQFGEVAANQGLADSLKSTNPGAYAGAQPPGEPGQGGGGAPLPPPSAPASPGGMPQAQPAPKEPPYNPAHAFPDLTEHPTWRQHLQMYAAPHRPYLSHFADMANREQQQLHRK